MDRTSRPELKGIAGGHDGGDPGQNLRQIGVAALISADRSVHSASCGDGVHSDINGLVALVFG